MQTTVRDPGAVRHPHLPVAAGAPRPPRPTQLFRRGRGPLRVAGVSVFCSVVALHGFTQWGHDFRPDYLKLGQLREMTGAAPWAALTATANTQVRQWGRWTGL